jgi:hypothetical protein
MRIGILGKAEMIDNSHTSFSPFSLHFSVPLFHIYVNCRLSTITVFGFHSVLRDNDHCVEGDAQRVSGILSPPYRHRSRLPPILLWVYRMHTLLTCSLDSADGTVTLMNKVLNTMTQALLQAPNFDLYEDISPPFGLLLFYLFNFIISVCTPPTLNFC